MGLFTNFVRDQRGVGLATADMIDNNALKSAVWLTKGGGGIWQILTLADKGGRGGLANADMTEKML